MVKAEHMKIKNVKMIPDGSGNFTRYMGMLIGKKSFRFWYEIVWRYMAIINDGVIERLKNQVSITKD